MPEERVACKEVPPRLEGDRVRPRKDRERVEAVRRNDPDRDEEEDDEPGNRQAQQARAGQVEPRACDRPLSEWPRLPFARQA